MEIRLTGSLAGPGTVSGAGQAPSKELGWEPGQVLKGQVTGQTGEDAYLIKVDGREVVAHSALPLTKGQTIAMEVQGQKDGAYQVKLLSTAPPLGSADLGEVLSRLGLKDTSLNRTLVQEFLARNLPLKPDQLMQGARLVQGLGGAVGERIKTVMLAVEGGIPLKGPLVEALHTFIEGFRQGEGGQDTPSLTKFLSQLGEVLGEEPGGVKAFVESGTAPLVGKGNLDPASAGVRDLPGRREIPVGDQPAFLGDASRKGAASPGGQGLSPANVQKEVQVPSSPQEGPKVLFQQLRDLTQTLMLQPEENGGAMASQLKDLMTAQLPRGGGLAPGLAGSEGDGLGPGEIQGSLGEKGVQTGKAVEADGRETSLPDRLKALNSLEKGDSFLRLSDGLKKQGILENLSVTSLSTDKTGQKGTILTGQSPAESPGTSWAGGEKPSLFSPVVDRFLRLIQEVQRSAEQARDNPTIQGLLKEGTAVEKQLVGQQVMQALDRGEQKTDYLYFSLPLKQEGNPESWGQLRIAKDGKKGRVIDPNRFSLALLLNTETLGPVQLEIKVWDKEVKASGKTAEDGVVQAFRSAWPALQERFAALGFRLQAGEWQVGSVEKSLLPDGEEGLSPPLDLSFLDVKV